MGGWGWGWGVLTGLAGRNPAKKLKGTGGKIPETLDQPLNCLSRRAPYCAARGFYCTTLRGGDVQRVCYCAPQLSLRV